MGNPKKFDMEQHTKQKVAIYDAYLRRYLKIVPRSYPRVSLFDPCAGKGKYGEYCGSAVVACNCIHAHAGNAPKDGFHLYLNEPDNANRNSLKQFCQHSFVKEITNFDAKDFINIVCDQELSGHKLWFIDPYGYTQVRRENIDTIMNQNSTEILLFIPLTFIYRFLKGKDTEKKLLSVANFLKDFSISQAEAITCSSPLEFANLISKKLQTLYRYSWHATMREGPLHYSLVYIGKHHYGLEKFLEARDNILTDKTETQLSLIPMGEELDLLELLPSTGFIDNCWCGVRFSWTPNWE